MTKLRERAKITITNKQKIDKSIQNKKRYDNVQNKELKKTKLIKLQNNRNK